jgi:murein DD-endopeptidase MepM/ murein hydrolase activator NlpD
MIKRISIRIILFLVLFTSNTYGQIKLKTYSEKIEKGFKFLADNNEYCPVSVRVDLELSNMSSSKGNHKIFVIPSRTKNYLITKLKMRKPGRYSYRTRTKFNFGNSLKEDYDKEYVYNLPYKNKSAFKLYQGYNGASTHQNKNALDFSMPIGTPIYAAREGVVVKVVEKNTITCYKKECGKYNNSILIFHVDGTFSSYLHIDTNGAVVEVGDTVAKGQLIAKSGNIGWSSGPHLHFEVFQQKIGKRTTLKTKFKINEVSEATYLKEKEKYTRNYN